MQKICCTLQESISEISTVKNKIENITIYVPGLFQLHF